MTRAFIFPGQGSQFIGMGQALATAFPVAREVFEEIDETLSQSLSKLMFEGPEDDLNLTENTQPALMAVSLAVTRVLEKEGGFTLSQKAGLAAGHSLGEYSALAATGAFSLSDTAKLLKQRGQAMQAAVPVGQGAMAAILGLELDTVQEVAKAASDAKNICAAANDNAFGQVVVSGHKDAVERAIALASERGAKRAVMLPVSAPFHSPLMEPAAKIMQGALDKTEVNTPSLPIVANVTAQTVLAPGEIRKLLVTQVTGMVRWRESVLFMKDQGVSELVELGAGKVLSGLTRRIDKDISAQSIGTPEDIEAFLNSL